MNDQFINLSQSQLKLTALYTLLFNFLKKSFNESNTHHMFVIESLHLYKISSFLCVGRYCIIIFVVGVFWFNIWIVFICFNGKWMNVMVYMNNEWYFGQKDSKTLTIFIEWNNLATIIIGYITSVYCTATTNIWLYAGCVGFWRSNDNPVRQRYSLWYKFQ